jgi:putative ABC transport system permease protein
MQVLMQDIRFAFRMLRRSPGFTLAVVLAIALATGANTAVFSVVYSVILRPLPFPDPSSLVSITQFYPALNQSVVASPTYSAWRDGSSGAAEVAAYSMGDLTLRGSGMAERVTVGMVTHNFFDVLGARMRDGRNFSADEDRPGANGVAIISEGFRNERLAGDRPLGRQIELDGKRYEVIGVNSEPFGFPPGVRIWIPLALNTTEEAQRGPVQLVRVIGRLGRGVPAAALSTRLQTASARTQQAWSAGSRVVILPLSTWLTGKTHQVWFLLMGSVAAVLLIACANIAGLLIARGSSRRREMAIRLAIGAGMERIRRQLLTESLLLSSLGSITGLVIAALLIHLLTPLIPDPMLAGRAIQLDGPVFLFTALVAFATGVLFGFAPARNASRVDAGDSLRRGSHTLAQGDGIRMRSVMVCAEIAVSMTLVVTASLMARSFMALTAVDPGFRADHLLTFMVNLPSAAYRDAERQQQFYGRALEAVAGMPGIEAAGLVSALPFGAAGASRVVVSVEGEPPWGVADAERHRVESLFVSDGYFPAMGTGVIEGRGFRPEEMTRDSRAVVINESMARRFFGRSSAVSRRLKTGLAESPTAWMTIVGVVRDSKRSALDSDTAATVFRPFAASTGLRAAGFVVRAGIGMESVAVTVRQVFAELDREVAISDSQSMERRLSGSMASQRLRAIASSLLAFVAATIVVAGLYGLLSYIVSQRTAEFGLRIALGAQPADIFRMVLRRGFTLAFTGTIAGIALSAAASRLLQGLLFSVTAVDPLTLVMAGLGMLTITAVACAVPARKATRTDPMNCLREE